MKIIKDGMVLVSKLWGSEKWICNNDKYCGKILHINENSATSMHYHLVKDEVLYVSSGTLKIVYGYGEEKDAKTEFINVGEAFHIPVGLRHRLIAHEGAVDIYEFSTHHEDADSKRVSPGYDGTAKNGS